MLNWYGRSHCFNRTVNKSFAEIEEMKNVILKYEEQNKAIVSPYLKRLSKGAYTADFAQKLVDLRASTNISRSTFSDKANEVLSLVPAVVHKLGGIPKLPCPNTIKSWEQISRHSFIQNAKTIIFSQASPTTLCCDSVKKSGCLGKKVTPIRATTQFEAFQFGMTYFSYLIDKHSDAGNWINNKLMVICNKFGLIQLSFYVGDSAGSQVRAWCLFRKSDVKYADWTVFVADFPHTMNTPYQLASELLCGIKKGQSEFKQTFIAWLLTNTKKIIENNDVNIEYVLQHFAYNTYNKIVSGADTRFTGFIESIESLLFATETQSNRKKVLKLDHAKLLLIANILLQYQASRDVTNKETVQSLIAAYSNRCIHACSYSIHCIGKKCVWSSMKFCQSEPTRIIGTITRIATDIDLSNKLKTHLIDKLKQCDTHLINASIDTRHSLFDFSSVQLKNCVDKIPNCNSIRPNNKLKKCQMLTFFSGMIL